MWSRPFQNDSDCEEFMTDLRGLCPSCGQSGLRQRRFIPSDELVTLCQECDSVWLSGTPVADATSLAFSNFLEARGHSNAFGALEEISTKGGVPDEPAP